MTGRVYTVDTVIDMHLRVKS